MPSQESCFVPGSDFGLARRSESICSHEQISVSLIRFVRQHLRTHWFRWMIRDDSVQTSYLMQVVGTQDSSILDQTPRRKGQPHTEEKEGPTPVPREGRANPGSANPDGQLQLQGRKGRPRPEGPTSTLTRKGQPQPQEARPEGQQKSRPPAEGPTIVFLSSTITSKICILFVIFDYYHRNVANHKPKTQGPTPTRTPTARRKGQPQPKRVKDLFTIIIRI